MLDEVSLYTENVVGELDLNLITKEKNTVKLYLKFHNYVALTFHI